MITNKDLRSFKVSLYWPSAVLRSHFSNSSLNVTSTWIWAAWLKSTSRSACNTRCTKLISQYNNLQLQCVTNMFLHYQTTFYTSDQLCALFMCPAEGLLLLFEEEVCLVWGQAAEISPHGEVEPQLSGRAQTGLSKGQQLTVGVLLAGCKGSERTAV